MSQLLLYVVLAITKGSDLVEWLNNNVEGFLDRRHARKYAALMLKVYMNGLATTFSLILVFQQHGFIRHTVNKITFSEQCYYVFGDMKSASHSQAIGRAYTGTLGSDCFNSHGHSHRP